MRQRHPMVESPPVGENADVLAQPALIIEHIAPQLGLFGQ